MQNQQHPEKKDKVPVIHSFSRRQLLKTAAALAAFPTIVPASALARGLAAPSERLTFGVIGLGDRGPNHIQDLLNRKEAQVVAVCDPYKSKQEKQKKLVEDHYASTLGDKSTYKGCDTYADFRKIMERSDIDAVVVAAPEFWHALIMGAAARAGKSVYGEKALTLTVEEGQKLCEIVRRYNCVFQIGTQQRSDRNFRFACELARNGYLGDLQTIKIAVPGGRALPDAKPAPVPADLDYEMWLGPAPQTPYNDLKCTFNWYFIYDYCVGWIQSWGVHHIDIALWGEPLLHTGKMQLEGTATFPQSGIADTSVTWNVNCIPEKGPRLQFCDDTTFKHGCLFEGTKGWVHVDRGGIQAEPASLLKLNLKPGDTHLYESNDHMGNFLECARSRREPAAPVEGGHRATTMTLIADIASRLNRKLTWDWSKEQFVGDEAANRMLSRPMRSPWHL